MKAVGIILIIIGIVCFGMGIYKYSVYENNEKSSWATWDNKNAYVGGDAYNYIINANYFTGWSVLGACFFISGVILFSISMLKDSLSGLNSYQSKPYIGRSKPYIGKGHYSTTRDGDNSQSGRGWTCPNCFARNSFDSSTCKDCGTHKP